MPQDIDRLTNDWIAKQSTREKRYPKPRKPRVSLSFDFEAPDELAEELYEYIQDAYWLWLDSKGLI